MLFYKPSLERLGIAVSVRIVDPTQYENRLRSCDFDIVHRVWRKSLSPGNEQREFWGSQAADTPGSRNIIGIKNPAVDTLIERVIFAKDRDDLVAATKALDRVLLWNLYVVPQWNYPQGPYRALGPLQPARAELPKYGFRFPDPVVVRCRQGRQDRQTILKDSSRMAPLSRRHVLGLGVGALGAACAATAAAADAGTEAHGISVFGDLKYPADFHHFDYVNAAAPKGGVFSLIPSSAPTISPS